MNEERETESNLEGGLDRIERHSKSRYLAWVDSVNLRVADEA